MNNHLTIRMAIHSDYPAIRDLCLNEGWKGYARDDFDAAFDNSVIVVGTVGDRVAAFARALTDGHITVFVCELIVAQEYRKMGYGRRVLEYLHGLYPTTRTDLISDADGFYEAVGFRILGNGFRKNYD